jgi:serine/threonine protein phosphatase PrpC
MSIYFTSQKGNVRPTNEDGHTIKTCLNNEINKNQYAKVNIYGIYDGHGGSTVSKFLQENIPSYFLNKKLNYPLKKNYIYKIYNHLQNSLTQTYNHIAKQCGSTCLCVLHFQDINNKNVIQILNTGDCRLCVCNGNVGINLTEDHKPNSIKESIRIKKLGGKIIKDGSDYRICNLSVSRAFGDNDARPYVTHIPDIIKYTIKPNDKFIILACDGLWDVMTNQQVIDFILSNCYKNNKRINKTKNIAQLLAKHAINTLKSTDNVSVIIVFFDR